VSNNGVVGRVFDADQAPTLTMGVAGRLTTRTPDPFFSAETPATWTYWPSGRRKTMEDGTGTTSYAYDQRDRLLETDTPDGILIYTRDGAGNVKTVRSDSGAYTVDYGYDALNRLASVTDNAPGGGTTSYHYDDVSRMTSYAYPNGVTTTMTYNSLNRVQNLAIATAADSLASYAYTFDPTGNRHSVTELSGRNVTWTYDSLLRLTNETITNAPTAGSIIYVYDNVGNRLSRTSTVPGISAQADTYNSDDESASTTFDNEGNTKSLGSNQYTYDSENRLISFNNGQISYTYNGDGRLVRRAAAGRVTTYLVDEANPTGYAQIAEERIDGAATTSYVYGSQRESMRNADGLRFFGYEVHSGVRVLMDSAGTVTDVYEYDAFGNVISRTGITDNSFTYRGEQSDGALGLQYLRARWMDTNKGRFWTRDTFEGLPMSPNSLHAFALPLAIPSDTTIQPGMTVPSPKAAWQKRASLYSRVRRYTLFIGALLGANWTRGKSISG
jgi:RHS repeat-associated protein